MFAKIESNADVAMNITLPLTANKSPLDEGKLIYPVVSTYRGQPSVVSGCGFRSGSVEYAAATPSFFVAGILLMLAHNYSVSLGVFLPTNYQFF